MKIKYSIHTTISKRDISGNCYAFSKVTNNKTGRSLYIDSGWGSDDGNIRHALHDNGVAWGAATFTSETIGIRDFNRIRKHTEMFNYTFDHKAFREINKRAPRASKVT